MSGYIEINRISFKQFKDAVDKLARAHPSVPITTYHDPATAQRILRLCDLHGITPAHITRDMLEDYEKAANAKTLLSFNAQQDMVAAE